MGYRNLEGKIIRVEEGSSTCKRKACLAKIRILEYRSSTVTRRIHSSKCWKSSPAAAPRDRPGAKRNNEAILRLDLGPTHHGTLRAGRRGGNSGHHLSNNNSGSIVGRCHSQCRFQCCRHGKHQRYFSKDKKRYRTSKQNRYTRDAFR